MSSVPEMKTRLMQLDREVQRGEDQYAAAKTNLEEAQRGLIMAGIDPDGDIDAQIKDLEIAAERAQAKAFDMFRKLQEKVLD